MTSGALDGARAHGLRLHVMELTSVAVYRRTIGASLERIWENVLDWEHLPWLHRSTFRHIRLLEHRPDGWRAETALREARGAGDFVIEVAVDRDGLLYHSRTVDGPGAGTDIVTRLEPRGPRATDIAVEFLVPGVSPEHAAPVGDAYTRTYVRLWDEDEAMMERRQAVLDRARDRARQAPARVDLGPESELRERLPLVVEAGGERYRVLEVDGTVVVHSTVCPHWGGPLADAPLEGGCITCPWHGYRYDVRTRHSVDGHHLALDPAPRLVHDAARRCALEWDRPMPIDR